MTISKGKRITKIKNIMNIKFGYIKDTGMVKLKPFADLIHSFTITTLYYKTTLYGKIVWVHLQTGYIVTEQFLYENQNKIISVKKVEINGVISFVPSNDDTIIFGPSFVEPVILQP